jgi:hypothetical protein
MSRNTILKGRVGDAEIQLLDQRDSMVTIKMPEL